MVAYASGLLVPHFAIEISQFGFQQNNEDLLDGFDTDPVVNSFYMEFDSEEFDRFCAHLKDSAGNPDPVSNFDRFFDWLKAFAQATSEITLAFFTEAADLDKAQFDSIVQKMSSSVPNIASFDEEKRFIPGITIGVQRLSEMMRSNFLSSSKANIHPVAVKLIKQFVKSLNPVLGGSFPWSYPAIAN